MPALWDPLMQLNRLQKSLGRFVGDTLIEAGEWLEGSQMVPVNIFETDQDVIVRVPVPGIGKEQLDVRLTNHTLSIRCLEKMETEERQVIAEEWTFGPYHRMVELPVEIRPEGIKAHLQDGVLTVTLPRATTLQTKKIEVAGEETEASTRTESGKQPKEIHFKE